MDNQRKGAAAARTIGGKLKFNLRRFGTFRTASTAAFRKRKRNIPKQSAGPKSTLSIEK
jgi:hypothetical protein